MPTRRKNKKRYRSRNNNKAIVYKSVEGLFGTKSIVRTMRYCARKTITPTAGALVANVFAANGIYDPDITGTGHQVRFFDQIMPSFNHFCVLKSKIHVSFEHIGNVTTQSPYTCIIALRDDTTLETNATGYMENGGCSYKTLPHAAVSEVNLKKSFDAKHFFGKKYAVDNYDLKGNISRNPLELAYYHVVTEPASNTGDAATLITITIDYIVQFSEPNPVGAS